jgi:hypothetical protein
MQRVYDWLVQHPDQRDTDEYRAKHDWLAEQLGLSPDTLEPLRSSPRAPRIEDNPSSSSAPAAPPPTEQTAERAERPARQASDTVPSTAEAVNVDSPAAVEVADTANVTDRKKRKPGAGNKRKLTDEEIGQLRGALDRKIDHDPKQGRYKNAREFLQHHALPKVMIARAVAKVDKITVGNSTLDRYVIEPVRRARRERLAISK